MKMDSKDGTLKKKYNSSTIMQKLEILKELEKGLSPCFVAQKFGISCRTVYDIKKNKEKFLSFPTLR